jgi:TRAP-type C4-dicarboxylate transport system substrate-binding protein
MNTIDDKIILEMLQAGSLDIARVSSPQLAAFFKPIEVLNMPYLFYDSNHMWKVLNSEIGTNFTEELKRAKFVVLTWLESSPRNFFNKKKEIKSINDLKDLKFGVSELEILRDFFKTFKSKPVIVYNTDIIKFLENGIIDGGETDLFTYYSLKYYKTAKYFTIDNHIFLPDALIMNLKSFEKLNDSDQILLMNIASRIKDSHIKLMQDYNKEIENVIQKEGCIITKLENRKELKKLVAPIYKDLSPSSQDLVEQIERFSIHYGERL